MKDFYYILGTDAAATPEEIREAYRQLSKKFRADGDSEDSYTRNHLREISEAFEVLNDPTRRMRYDAALKRAGLYPGQALVPKRSYYRTIKSIDIAFTIVLVLLTILFGDYVMKSISSSRKTRTQVVATANKPEPVMQPHKKHGKKAQSNPQIKTGTRQAGKWQRVNDTAKATSWPVKPKTVAEALPQVAPVALAASTPAAQPDYLYAAYLRPSKAGAIYMRKDDHYGSNSVTIIPENSKVLILAEGDTFYKITYNNITGYVLKKSVQPQVIN